MGKEVMVAIVIVVVIPCVEPSVCSIGDEENEVENITPLSSSSCILGIK